MKQFSFFRTTINKHYKLKRSFLYATFLLIGSSLALLSNSSGPASAGNGGRTGAPGDFGNCSNCHGGGSYTPSVLIEVFDNGTTNPATSYIGGSTYDIKVTVSSTTGAPKFGFQLTTLKSTNVMAGSYNTPSSNTKISTFSGRTYLEHNATSTTGVFTAKWVAPASGTGTVKFYANGNCVNGTGGTSGDNSVGTSLTLTETIVCIPTGSTINNSICQYSSIIFNGQSINTAGTYYDTLVNAGGCDSIITLNLAVNTLPTINTSATATNTCLGSSVSISATSNAVNPIFEWTKDYMTYYPITVADVPSSTGTVIYSVRVTDANSCSNYNSVFMNVNPPSGILAQSTAGLSVTGFADDQQVQSANSSLHYFDANCNLIASVNLNVPGTSALDTTNVEVIVDASVQTFLTQPYCRRNFYILPKTQGSAEVTLYLTQSDFDDYNANNGTWPDLPTGPLDTAGINRVRITKVEGDGLGFSPAEVITPTMFWNGTYWEATFMVTSFSKFYFHAANPANAPLPVTLTSFIGKKEATSNMLNWVTSMEQNNAYFNVQHSQDGKEFAGIGKVSTKAINGNSSALLNYEFRDKNSGIGNNYYRLQQLDMDGKSSYSEVINIYRDSNDNMISIYPNPTEGILNIEYSLLNHENTLIELYDISGRVMRSSQSSSLVTQLNMTGLAAGIYVLQISQDNLPTLTHKVEKK